MKTVKMVVGVGLSAVALVAGLSVGQAPPAVPPNTPGQNFGGLNCTCAAGLRVATYAFHINCCRRGAAEGRFPAGDITGCLSICTQFNGNTVNCNPSPNCGRYQLSPQRILCHAILPLF